MARFARSHVRCGGRSLQGWLSLALHTASPECVHPHKSTHNPHALAACRVAYGRLMRECAWARAGGVRAVGAQFKPQGPLDDPPHPLPTLRWTLMCVCLLPDHMDQCLRRAVSVCSIRRPKCFWEERCVPPTLPP